MDGSTNDGFPETCFQVNKLVVGNSFDILITTGENHLLLRATWNFLKSLSEYESVFRICVWIITHKT